MNERVQALRELSVTTQPHIDMERAKSETATYKKYEGQLSVPELRAQVLYDYFAAKTLYIGDGELIVGEKGDSPHGAPTFPELCCHSIEDMHVMNDRQLFCKGRRLRLSGKRDHPILGKAFHTFKDSGKYVCSVERLLCCRYLY